MAVTIPCTLCQQPYSVGHLSQISLRTMVCAQCYRSMQQQSVAQSCFGKVSVFEVVNNKPIQVVRAYHPQAAECDQWCPDRKICRAVLKGESL